MSKLSEQILAGRGHGCFNAAYKLAKEVEALEERDAAIMRDYQIEGDKSVRDIVERTTTAAARLRDKLQGIKECECGQPFRPGMVTPNDAYCIACLNS